MKLKFEHLRYLVILEAALMIFLGIFYFSCGETLFVRSSDGNISEFYATNDVGELTEGMTVTQTYTSRMDLIDSIGVMVSNYGKPLSSELTIRCEDLTEGHMIAEQTFSGDVLGINQYVYLELPDGYQEMKGNLLQITCISNAVPGDAPTVLYNVENMLKDPAVAENAQLAVNGAPTGGTLCIAVQGRNYVWTGPNFWKLAILAAVLVALFFGVEALRSRLGKVTLLFNGVQILKKYWFLIKQLVQRDFKVRYKRSVLGVFWSFLNPLLMMTVQYVVFSQLFKSDIDNYPVYLLSGLVVFNFFNEGVSVALNSIVGNASLITKVYIPKYIYPVTRVLSSGINLVMSLIPLMLAAVLTGERITRAYLMLPYILFCVVVFTIGLGMILAAAMTFFRDVQFLWGIVSMIWMYLTPMFYPISIVPETFKPFIMNNPMYLFVSAVRNIVMDGIAPRPLLFCKCTLIAGIMLLAGCAVFKKTQDRFVFYI